MGQVNQTTNDLIDAWNNLAQTAVEFGLLKKAHDDGVAIDDEAFELSEKKLVKVAREFSILCDLYIEIPTDKNERNK